MPRTITVSPFPASPQVDTLVEFGAFVRAQRTQAGLRIDDAAALCGVSVELLSELEGGRRSVGLDKALLVTRQLGLALLVVPRTALPQVLHRIGTPDSAP